MTLEKEKKRNALCAQRLWCALCDIKGMQKKDNPTRDDCTTLTVDETPCSTMSPRKIAARWRQLKEQRERRATYFYR